MPQYDVNLRDYWRIVRKRKTIIIFAGLMLGLFSLVASLASKPAPIFKADAKVRFQISEVAENPFGFGTSVSYYSGIDDLDTQKEIITSYEVLERVAILTGRLDTTEALTPSEREEKRITAILGIKNKVATSIDGLTSIININATSANADSARSLANAVAAAYRDYNRETTNRQAFKTREFILSQRNSVRDSVAHLARRIKEFRQRENMMDVDTQTEQVLGQMNSAEELLGVTQSAIENIGQVLKNLGSPDAVSETTLATILPSEGGGVFVKFNSQLNDLNAQRNTLLIEFTDLHPQVHEIDIRKNELIRNMIQSLRNRREALRRRELIQQSKVNDLKKEYHRLPEIGLQFAGLEQALALKNELLVFYEQRAQEAEIRSKEEIQEVEIIQRALRPGSPTNPSDPTTTSAVGTIMGLILGVVFAFIAETMDTSIGTIEDVEEYLGVSVVGIIPQIDIDDVKESLIRKGVPADDNETLDRRSRLAAHFDPQSTMAESYRALRTNIQFVNVERGAKAISVTSASNQEGKSVSIANLALAMAQAGNRVLLVDCDLRRPTIYRTFGLDREPGLTDVILGNYDWKDVVRTVTDIMTGGIGMEDIMLTPGMDNLNIITSGAIPPNPAEITDSQRMDAFIAQVREEYDIVLFDSPPILQATDATVLGTKLDGVLLVYKIGQISRGALRRAKLQMDNVNIPVLGVILNGLRADVSEDFQDLRYYTYYAYGSEHKELSRFEKFKKKLKPATDLLGKVRGLFLSEEEEEDQGEAPSEDEKGPSLLGLTAKLLLYLILITLVLIGVLWQIGLFERTPPTRPSPSRPSEERVKMGVKKPNPKTSLLAAYHPEIPSRDRQIPAVKSVGLVKQPNPLPSSPREGHGQSSINRSDRSLEEPAASDARSVSPPIEHRFAVQVGDYRDKREAQRMAERLRKSGYGPRTLPTSGSGLTRVVIEGFDTPQAAGGKVHRLRRSGLAPGAVIVVISTESEDQGAVLKPADDIWNSLQLADGH